MLDNHNVRTISQSLYVSSILQTLSQSSTCTTSMALSDTMRPLSQITESQFPPSAVESIDLLQDIFTWNFHTGVHISLFCEGLQHAMKMDGLPSFNMNISENLNMPPSQGKITSSNKRVICKNYSHLFYT